MDCRTWEERTSALVDYEVSDQEASFIFAHLAECASCRRFHRNVLLIQRDLVQSPESFPTMPEHKADGPQRDATGLSAVPTRMGHAAAIRVPRRLALSAAALIMILAGSTATLLFQGPLGSASERIIFVGSLPTVEVEATYIPHDTKKL